MNSKALIVSLSLLSCANVAIAGTSTQGHFTSGVVSAVDLKARTTNNAKLKSTGQTSIYVCNRTNTPPSTGVTILVDFYVTQASTPPVSVTIPTQSVPPGSCATAENDTYTFLAQFMVSGPTSPALPSLYRLSDSYSFNVDNNYSFDIHDSAPSTDPTAVHTYPISVTPAQ